MFAHIPRMAGLLAVASLLSFSPVAHAVPEPDDLAGPPPFSINGCPAHQAWTTESLAQVFDVVPAVIRRMNRRFGVSNVEMCTMHGTELHRLMGRATEPKYSFDKPDQAARFRAMSYLDDTGTIRDGGLQEAYAQRQAILASPPPAKLGGLTPGQPFWQVLGPVDIAGRVRAILPMSPTRVLVGSVSGGLWMSENAGAAWAPVRDFMANVAIACLVPDPGDPTIIYVCTGEGFFNFDAIRGDGIYRITGADGPAASWVITQVPGTSAAAGSQWRFVNRLVVLPNGADPGNVNNRLLVAATNNGIYRSTNGGTSFAQVRTGRHLDLDFHPMDWARLVAGNDAGGVSISGDGGATWAAATTGLPVASGQRVEITPVPGVAQKWYASIYVNGGEAWQTVDNGVNWTKLPGSLTNVLGGQGWYDNIIWSSPNGLRIIVGGVTQRMSVDGGATFGSVGGGNYHVDHHIIVNAADYGTTGQVYLGNDGGVYRSSNIEAIAVNNPASPWTTLNGGGLAITQFYGGAGVPGRITGGTQDRGSYTWSGSGTTWAFTQGGDGGEGAVDPTNNLYVYGSTQNMGLFRSINGGASRDAYICTGITDADCVFGANPNPKTNFIPPFILDPNNPARMLAGGESLWRTNDVRAAVPAWTAIKGAQPNQFGGESTYINFIAVRPGDANAIWVGYNDGQLWRTANGTAVTPAWERVTFNGITNPTRQVMRIVFDPADANKVWVTFAGYQTGNVVVTSNATAAAASVNWTSIHGNLPAAPVRSLARHPSIPTTLYAGTEVGVFATDDGGANWSTQSEGPGTVSVEELFFLDGSTLVAATHGRGMFRATINLATAPGTVQLASAAAGVQEGAAVQLSVNRIGGSFGAASVNYATASGSATSGTDFTASSGSLIWADGDATAKTITVQTATDALTEGVETFTVTLSGVAGASLGTPAVATVSLADPEAFPLAGALPPGAWSQPTTTTGGATDPSIVKGWIVDTNPANAHEGTMSLRSDVIASVPLPGQKAVMELRTYTGAGNFSFARKVGSEAGYDCLRFYIDGVVQGVGGTCANVGGIGASGSLPYAVQTYPVTAGMHTFRWSYEKDEIVDTAPDAAWIDAITLPATGLDPAADSDGDSVPNGVELNEAINPTVKDNDVFAATAKGARLFAMQQYRDFLSREGEAAGIQAWTGLMTGGTTRDAVINAFFNSPEFNGFVAPVVRLYYATFLRVPDYAGLTFNAGLVRNGTVTLLQLADFFTVSPEFAATYGALDNTAFVTLLYNNVLGRAPDPAGLSGWVGLLEGGMSRGQVLLGFSDSVEYQAAKFNEVYVTMMYVGMLRRSPEPGGYAGWLTYLQQPGNTPLAMINGFYLSTEYRNRFLP